MTFVAISCIFMHIFGLNKCIVKYWFNWYFRLFTSDVRYCRYIGFESLSLRWTVLKTPRFRDFFFSVACRVAFSISNNTDFHSLNLAVFLLSIFEYSNKIHSNSKYLITSKGMDYLNPCYCINLREWIYPKITQTSSSNYNGTTSQHAGLLTRFIQWQWKTSLQSF